MKNYILLVLLSVLTIISCNTGQEKQIEVEHSKYLIPEGIAVNPETGTIYLSSLHQQKIVKIDNEGTMKDLIHSNQYGFLSGIGMTVHLGQLYAASNSLNPSPGESLIFILDPESGNLINKYQATDTLVHLFNDLAVTAKGRIFITDTYTNALYTIAPSSDSIELFLRSEEIKWPNGIALSEDDNRLFVASTAKGIRVIDPVSAEILSPPDTASRFLDGLQLAEKNLIGIQNGGKENKNIRLLQFILNENQSKILHVNELMKGHPSFDVPTTLDVIGNKMYILANSQLRNLNQEINVIKDSAKLHNVRLLIENIPE